MDGVITTLLGTVILFPFIITIVILIIMRKLGKAPVSVIGFAADLTTPFLFIAVYVVSNIMFGEGIGVYIGGFAIIIAIVHAFIERSRVKEFSVVRLLRKTWRFYFLVLMVAYLTLLAAGTILKIVEYVN